MDDVEIEVVKRKLCLELSRTVAIPIRDLPCLLDADAIPIQLALKELARRGEIRSSPREPPTYQAIPSPSVPGEPKTPSETRPAWLILEIIPRLLGRWKRRGRRNRSFWKSFKRASQFLQVN